MDRARLESLGLRRLAPADRAPLAAALAALPPLSSELATASLFAWDFFTRLYAAEIEGARCLFSTYDGSLSLWGPPLVAAPGAAFDRCMEVLDAAGGADPRALYIPEASLPALAPGRYEAAPQGREYLYRREALASMAGGRLKRRRSEASRFEREQAWAAAPYAVRFRGECEALLERWLAQKRGAAAAPAVEDAARKTALEAEATRRLLAAEDPDLAGLVVRVDGSLAAFTLAAPLGARAHGEAAVLVEKTDRALPGLASFVFRLAARELLRDFATVNAGEDWDLPGLAAAKRAFAPHEIRRTFVVRRAR
jgi:hypothetical protein